jgi:hypothetical protein
MVKFAQPIGNQEIKRSSQIKLRRMSSSLKHIHPTSPKSQSQNIPKKNPQTPANSPSPISTPERALQPQPRAKKLSVITQDLCKMAKFLIVQFREERLLNLLLA